MLTEILRWNHGSSQKDDFQLRGISIIYKADKTVIPNILSG